MLNFKCKRCGGIETADDFGEIVKMGKVCRKCSRAALRKTKGKPDIGKVRKLEREDRLRYTCQECGTVTKNKPYICRNNECGCTVFKKSHI